MEYNNFNIILNKHELQHLSIGLNDILDIYRDVVCDQKGHKLEISIQELTSIYDKLKEVLKNNEEKDQSQKCTCDVENNTIQNPCEIHKGWFYNQNQNILNACDTIKQSYGRFKYHESEQVNCENAIYLIRFIKGSFKKCNIDFEFYFNSDLSEIHTNIMNKHVDDLFRSINFPRLFIIGMCIDDRMPLDCIEIL